MCAKIKKIENKYHKSKFVTEGILNQLEINIEVNDSDKHNEMRDIDNFEILLMLMLLS